MIAGKSDRALPTFAEPAAKQAGDERPRPTARRFTTVKLPEIRSAISTATAAEMPGSRIVRPADLTPTMKPPMAKARKLSTARAESVAASAFDRYPIRGTFFGCCASTVTATASIAPANRIASAVFLNDRLIQALFIMRTEAKKSVIYKHHFSVAIWEIPQSCKR